MEESAQRRERLKAMRMEASQEATTYNNQSEHSSLSNPLLESTPNPEAHVQSHAQSFNYYTDPMAAFSGNKQRSKVNPQISQDYSSTPPRSMTNQTFPSPAPQPHYSPDPRMQQPQGRFGYPSPGPGIGGYPSPSHPGHGSGRGYPSPSPSPGPHFSNSLGRGYPSSAPNQDSGQGRGCPSPRPHYGQGQGGYPSPGPHHGPGQGGYPSPGPHYGPGLGYHHGPGQGGYPSPGPNQGRGHWFGTNMGSGSSSGRGRGQWSGQGGGRGRGRGGSHNHVSAEERPDMFYNKSMVEDPWKFLEPVIWKSHKKPWLPNSLSIKKPRVSESPRQQSTNQPSLAEILAASFNDAANGESEPEP